VNFRRETIILNEYHRFRPVPAVNPHELLPYPLADPDNAAPCVPIKHILFTGHTQGRVGGRVWGKVLHTPTHQLEGIGERCK